MVDQGQLGSAAFARSGRRPPTPNFGNLRDDLVVVQRHQMTLMNSPLFRTVAPALTAHFSTDAELVESYVRDFVDLRRSAVRAVVQRAVACGELPGEIDVDMLYDVLTGPLFYRAIARGERLDRKFVEGIVERWSTSFRAQGLSDEVVAAPQTRWARNADVRCSLDGWNRR